MSLNLFEKASREAWRFQSAKGQISVEQLWALPLKDAKTNFDLDSVAKAVNADVKTETEESFVVQTRTDQTPRQKLDLVKHIIGVKLMEADAVRAGKARAEEKQKLLGILEAKQDAALQNSSEEEIRRRIAELG